MKKLFFSLIIPSLLLVACSPSPEGMGGVDTSDPEIIEALGMVLAIEANCLDSGGSYGSDVCTCSDETYDFNGQQVPLYSLDAEGYCIDPMGIPGGILREEAVDDYLPDGEEPGFNGGVDFLDIDGALIQDEKRAVREEIGTQIDGVVSGIFLPTFAQDELVYVSIAHSPQKEGQSYGVYQYDRGSKALKNLYSEAYSRELFPMAMDGGNLILFHVPIDFSGGMCMNFFQNFESDTVGRLSLDLNDPTELMGYELPVEIAAQGDEKALECTEDLMEG